MQGISLLSQFDKQFPLPAIRGNGISVSSALPGSLPSFPVCRRARPPLRTEPLLAKLHGRSLSARRLPNRVSRRFRSPACSAAPARATPHSFKYLDN